MKHSINVSLQPVKNSDLFPVRLRVSWCGIRCDLPVGVSYNPGKWIKEIGRAKQNTRNTSKQSATEINGKIEDAVRWVDAFFIKYELDAAGSSLTAKTLKETFLTEFRNKGTDKKQSADINFVFERFILETAKFKSWSENTIIKYNSLKVFIKEYRLQFSNFNEDFFLFFIENEIKKGRKNSTIYKNIRLFKVFANYCLKNGFVSCDLSKFSPRLKWSGQNKKAIVFLEFSEIEKLINYTDLTPSFLVTKDLFVFSCFTGLRYSDIMNLKKNDIKDGKIYVITKKTSDALIIETNHYSLAIIEKYSQNPGNFLFPRVSVQSINFELKSMFKKIGLDRPVKKVSFCGSERIEKFISLCDCISFHAGRRSFVVECLRRGISPAVIMKWTGHSDYSAMKPYIEIVDSLKSSEMAKFDL